MTDLEIKLLEIMVKLIVRYPDGLARIQTCLESAVRAGFQMIEEHKEALDKEKVLH
jgi:hypothetical protein